VFDRLKSLITSGELKPGDVMPSERDLLERFGVGRPAIREAMQQLSNMGLSSWLREYHTEMLIWTGKENLRLVEHEEIINCVAAGDPDAAEAAVTKRLDRSAALYVHQSGH
jgi:DNA-binding FadR family transcriptional regulator